MIQARGNLGGLPKKQQRKQIVKEHSLDASYMVPDRVTGLQELEELRRLCPGRAWNFVMSFCSGFLSPFLTVAGRGECAISGVSAVFQFFCNTRAVPFLVK